jgi:hypothetical protein
VPFCLPPCWQLYPRWLSAQHKPTAPPSIWVRALRCISAIAIVTVITGTAVAGVNRAGGTIVIVTMTIAGGVMKSGNVIAPMNVSANVAGMNVNVVTIGVTIIAMMIVVITAITIITKQKNPADERDFSFLKLLPTERFADQ